MGSVTGSLWLSEGRHHPVLMNLKLCKSAAKLFIYEIDETLMMNVLCGVLSGVISSSIANPTDVLKVIM